MNLRIRVERLATGGNMPESVEVEWEIGSDESIDGDLAQTMLGMMLRAPSARTVGAEVKGLTREAVRRGDLLGLTPESIVIRAAQGRGIKFTHAGFAADSMEPGTWAWLRDGEWRRSA
jgi:hypothetical protein